MVLSPQKPPFWWSREAKYPRFGGPGRPNTPFSVVCGPRGVPETPHVCMTRALCGVCVPCTCTRVVHPCMYHRGYMPVSVPAGAKYRASRAGDDMHGVGSQLPLWCHRWYNGVIGGAMVSSVVRFGSKVRSLGPKLVHHLRGVTSTTVV